MAENTEPWLRGSHEELPAVLRAVVHALELGREDVQRWCANLTDEEWNLSVQGLAPAAFHLRHMARSMDRLLTYAEGRQLDGEQLELMKSELGPGATGAALLAEWKAAVANAEMRVRAFQGSDLESKRSLGRKALPTTLGGCLVHVAEHTARHLGQLVVTAKLAVGARQPAVIK